MEMEFSYKTEGMRSLLSMDYFELKPVTILVGLNNSGKSTLLRSLPLLKQSMESELVSPIDWSGKYVDFYDFATTLGRKNQQKEITFSFKFSSLPLNSEFSNNLEFSYYRDNAPLLSCLYPELVSDSGELRDVCYTFTVSGNNRRSFISKLEICIGNLDMKFKVVFPRGRREINDIEIDDKKLSDLIKFDHIQFIRNSIFSREIKLCLNFIKQENGKKIGRIVSLFGLILELNEILQEGTNIDENKIIPSAKSSLINEVSEITNKNFIRNPEHYFDKIPSTAKSYLRELGKIYLFWFTYARTNAILDSILSKLSYMAPARPGSYRNTKIKEVGFLDSRGSNLPNFLQTLESKHQQSFSKWVKELYGFGVDIESRNGFVNLLVEFGNEKLNIDDTGFSISQLLPVLTNIWWAMYRPINREEIGGDLTHVSRTITIEQPELHLHSVQQASIADTIASVLVDSAGSETPCPRFIVETHSEKLLSRISSLIYEGKLNHNDIQVVLFTSKNPVKPFESKVEVFPFSEQGKLKNFPIGFFNSRAN